MTSPTARTLKFLRDAGYTAAVVEKWNPHSKTRQDLFGFIDVVAMHRPTPSLYGLLGVQATSGSNHASRRTKLLALPAARQWVETGNRLWVVSWAKKGPPGRPRDKRKVWVPRVDEVMLGEFPTEASS